MMRRVLLVVLLLGLVVAGSALEKSDFNWAVIQNPVELSGEYKEIKIGISVGKELSAFDVKLKFVGMSSVQSQELIIDSDFIDSKKPDLALFHMMTTVPGTYDLSNAFEIVSWDDSVALEVDAIPETSDENVVLLHGQTDAASLCEEHQYVGFWGERDNCQVKVLVNNEEYWAERSGVFAVDYELEEGENRIDIRVQDPGGNTEETTLFVTYKPSMGTVIEDNMIPVVVGLVILVAGIIGLVVYWKSRKATHEDIVTETLGELRTKQERLFKDYANRSGMRGGYDEQSGKMLLDTFGQIVKKDMYYEQSFVDKRLAIKQREAIFQDERVTAGIKDILLQRYLQVLDNKDK